MGVEKKGEVAQEKALPAAKGDGKGGKKGTGG